MAIKILLADKSITIQKVVEMLFSGKEYEVLCVSDGETALSEAGRFLPHVVLADIDLPRVDGYSFSGRMKQSPALAKTPVILMMSRDDVFDEAKAKQVSISDHIAKPFESQELISKVKKAVAAAPPVAAGPAPEAARPAPSQPLSPVQPPPVRPATVPPASPKAAPKPQAPSDIFAIIEEAPTQADLKTKPGGGEEDEGVYEVEPVVEVEEEQLPRETSTSLPIGEKAMEEMREGLGLASRAGKADQDIVSFESLDMTVNAEKEFAPAPGKRPAPAAREWTPPAPAAVPASAAVQQPAISETDLWNMAEAAVSKMAREMFEKMPPVQHPPMPEDEVRGMVERTVSRLVTEQMGSMAPLQPPTVSEQELRRMAETTISSMSREVFATLPPLEPPPIPPETLRSAVEAAVQGSVSRIVQEVARDIIEKVAWEVVPDLAATLIKAEIERLKAET
jgi:CheY-like chemotaxis protein